MRVLSLVVLGLTCLYSVAGEEHLFKSETHGEFRFLFNSIERDSESLNNYQDMKGIFLAGSSLIPDYGPRNPRENSDSGGSSSSSDKRNNERGANTPQTNKLRK
jgi:hypothetical protein